MIWGVGFKGQGAQKVGSRILSIYSIILGLISKTPPSFIRPSEPSKCGGCQHNAPLQGLQGYMIASLDQGTPSVDPKP